MTLFRQEILISLFVFFRPFKLCNNILLMNTHTIYSIVYWRTLLNNHCTSFVMSVHFIWEWLNKIRTKRTKSVYNVLKPRFFIDFRVFAKNQNHSYPDIQAELKQWKAPFKAHKPIGAVKIRKWNKKSQDDCIASDLKRLCCVRWQKQVHIEIIVFMDTE